MPDSRLESIKVVAVDDDPDIRDLSGHPDAVALTRQWSVRVRSENFEKIIVDV
jgi:hypothetical protein